MKTIYDITTPFNQVHLMQKLVNMQLDTSKTASEHLNTFIYILNPLLKDANFDFDDNLRVIFLIMTAKFIGNTGFLCAVFLVL